ncbi:FG-GAP-like repeat-containing protein [Sediminicoccus sp. BL-A-41-H5]|uniref:FG-GAP-like repeat-containing protein n=1 Tax=Sediminicoccus sp. BL-A-41-H5 TaxID=3421106 RepID=UPI003D67D18E
MSGTITGRAGRNDLLRGTSLANSIDGLSGNDTLIGGGGDDRLTGGVGNDTFVFESTLQRNGFDVITDYQYSASASGQRDVLDLTAVLTRLPANSRIADYVRVTQDGNGALLWIDRDGAGGAQAQAFARLEGLKAGDLVRINIGGSEREDTRGFTLSVQPPPNQAPSVTSGATANFAENGSGTVYTATGTDPENTALTWTLGGADAALFNINAATGVVTFKTAPNFEAPTDAGADNVYNITVTASDGSNSSAARAVAITVTNVNEGPSVTSGATASFAENASGTVYTAIGTDPENTALTWTLGGADAALFDINASTGVVTFKTAPNFEAPADTGADNVYNVTVTASDGTLSSAAQAVAITVTNVNEGPSVTSGATANFAENASGTVYTATGTDPESNALTWVLGGADAARFDINASTGVVTFKTAPNFEAPADAGADNVYDITVTASDGSNSSAAQAVAITVTNVNEGPTVTSGATASFAENASGTVYTATGTDPENNALTWTLGGADAALFDINASTGVVTFKTAPDFEAPADAGANNVYNITVTASDGTFSSAAQAVAITVTNVNEGPSVTSGATASFAENASGTVYTATGTDPENNALTWVLGGADAARFDINANTGVVTFKTAPDFEAPADAGANNVYDITVTASDGSNSSAAQPVAITVTDVSEGPAITSGAAATVSENMTGTAYQAAGTTGVWSLSGTDRALFNIDAATGAVTFKESPDFEAPLDAGVDNIYDLTVTLTAGTQNVTKDVTITVTDENEAPVITSGSGSGQPFTLVNSILPADVRATSIARPVLVDLDGDARLDLVVGDGLGVLHAFRNTRDGFTPFANNPFASINLGSGTTAVSTAPAFVDLDDDGDLDLVVGTSVPSATNPSTTVGDLLSYENTGSGYVAFATDPFAGVDFPTTSDNPAPAFADLDNDGRLDLVIGTADGSLRALRNTDAGFVAFAVDPLASLNNGALASVDDTTPTFVDLDGDTDLDLVVGHGLGGAGSKYGAYGAGAPPALFAFENKGAGGFAPFTQDPLANIGVPALGTAPTFGDIDGDGALDLVVGTKYGGLRSFEATNAGFVSTDPANPLADVFGSLQFVDLDNDGDLDIFSDRLLGNSTIPGNVIALENTGTGYDVFAADPFANVLLPFVGATVFGDIDGDGDLDALLTSSYSGFGRVVENTAGSFAAFASDPLAGVDINNLMGGVLVDIDSDGALDIVAFRESTVGAPAALVAFRNVGGTFANFAVDPFAGVSVAGGASPIPVAAVDLDGDDDTDIIMSNGKYGELSSLENVDGSFQEFAGGDPLQGASVGLFGKPTFADLDGDGDLDLIVAGDGPLGSGAPRLFENTGAGFVATVDLGGISSGVMTRYAVADVNGDGELDVVATEWFGQSRVYERTFVDFRENATGSIYLGTATDPEGDAITWSISGTDALLFDINTTTGNVTFKAAPDFEAPGDADGNNRYELTITASDGTLSTDKAIILAVANVNEVSTITGNRTGSVAEDGTLTATGQLTVTDPDVDAARFALLGAEGSGTYGDLDLDPVSGQWTYLLRNTAANVQALNDAELVFDTFDIWSQDRTASVQISIGIAGASDIVPG